MARTAGRSGAQYARGSPQERQPRFSPDFPRRLALLSAAFPTSTFPTNPTFALGAIAAIPLLRRGAVDVPPIAPTHHFPSIHAASRQTSVIQGLRPWCLFLVESAAFVHLPKGQHRSLRRRLPETVYW